jgi:hypothetical protein
MSLKHAAALLATVLFLTLCPGCQAAGTADLSVPQGGPVTVDGTLAPGEWDDARKETFADGSELLLMYEQGNLYLGIRGSASEMIVGNIFVQHEGEIRILHTSAALGTAVYRQDAESWRQTQAFDWCCRRTDGSDAAQTERDAFFQDEGWVSINSRMGTPNELEYKIVLPHGSVRLAANLIRSSAPNDKVPWPSDLNDDCTKPTPGGLPEQMQFSLGQWASLRFS